MTDPAQVYQTLAARHLSADDAAVLAANGHAGMAAPDPEWAALNAEALALMHGPGGADPASPAAIDLARRWMTKVFAATGGDPGLTTRVRDLAREVHQQPAFATAAPEANAVMDFIAAAYGAAIAVGVMPPP